jgi:excisionase family DNA binding protein
MDPVMQLDLDKKAVNDAIQDAVFAGKGQYRKLLLRATEVSQATGWSRAKSYRAMRDGTLPVVRTGGSVRVPIDGLLEYIRKNTTSPAA